jgi:hypothetical protein
MKEEREIITILLLSLLVEFISLLELIKIQVASY